MSKMSKKIICITGSIGSGKSSVSNYLKDKGYPVLDLDEVVKKIYTQKEVINTINQTLFHHNEDRLDLKKVANIIFKDKDKREWIEAYLYPKVKQEMDLFTNQYEVCFVEMALVFEKGWEKYFTEIVCVYTEKEIAIKRLIAYRNFTSEEIENRLKSQLDALVKKERADVVIINNSDIEILYNQVDDYLKQRGL